MGKVVSLVPPYSEVDHTLGHGEIASRLMENFKIILMGKNS
jgi:hypothetical protein